MRAVVIAVCVLAQIIVAAPIAAAGPQAATEEEPEQEGYRMQIVGIDALAYAFGIGTLATQNAAGAYATGAAFAIGGPIIHARHQRRGRMWTSFGVRLALPTTLLLMAGDPCKKDDWDCGGAGGQLLVGFLGMLTASFIDVAIIAAPAPVRKPKPAWAPQVTATGDRVQVGLVGQF